VKKFAVLGTFFNKGMLFLTSKDKRLTENKGGSPLRALFSYGSEKPVEIGSHRLLRIKS